MAQNAGAQLARPMPDSVAAPRRSPARSLSAPEKAAVIVRLLVAEGAEVPLVALPEHMQAAITEQIGRMRLVDRTTLLAIVTEFVEDLEQVGLSFPGGLEGAISLMDGRISPDAASRLRRLAGTAVRGDPWDRITALPVAQLVALIAGESAEVAAVALSKLPVTRAAEVLAAMPGDRARRVAYAMSLTGDVAPETVRRIGAALVQQIDARPARAFDSGPVERVGAILNVASPATREDLLTGLSADDAGFAAEVRKALFTFVHIPGRIAPRDVPKVTRAVDPAVLVTALAAAQAQADLAPTVEHILGNISQRMAEGIREEIAARGAVKPRDGDAAMAEVITAIRALAAQGEIRMVTEDEA
jgi:flagellar motor switch protein FliG